VSEDIVLIPAHVSVTGRELRQNGQKIYVVSECCGLSINDSGIDARGAYALFCNGCEKRLAANPDRWASAVYHIDKHTGTSDNGMFKRWMAYMFGLENVEITVTE
jgi:hypothetical protein